MDEDDPTVSTAVLTVVLVLLAEAFFYIVVKALRQYRLKNAGESGAEEEIISMVNEGQEQGLIHDSEARMITNIFAFGDKRAQDIMTHRSNIVAIDGKVSLEEAIGFMLEERYSRYPVYEGNIDHILGILHIKDALRIQDKKKTKGEAIRDIPGLLLEAKFIPETRKVDVLFRTMQSTKRQMVIVMDEYGQTSGLIAMEDLLEEIVGSILDEYDEEEAYIAQTSQDEYLIDGLTPLKELEERFSIHFYEEEFETLNGFLIAQMDRIPAKREDFGIDVGEYHFRVLSVDNNRVQTVVVTRKTGSE